VNEAYAVYVAADKYCIQGLKKICEEYIFNSRLSPENIWEMLHNSLFLSLQRISNKCLDYLKRNTKASLYVDNFLEASASAVENVLLLDMVDISEIDLLNRVVSWADAHVKACPDETLENTLKPFLKLIRFGGLSAVQFCTFLEKRSDIFTESDALAILKHTVKPSNPLPEWCCKKLSRSLFAVTKFSDAFDSNYEKYGFRDLTEIFKRKRLRKEERKSCNSGTHPSTFEERLLMIKNEKTDERINEISQSSSDSDETGSRSIISAEFSHDSDSSDSSDSDSDSMQSPSASP